MKFFSVPRSHVYHTAMIEALRRVQLDEQEYVLLKALLASVSSEFTSAGQAQISSYTQPRLV